MTVHPTNPNVVFAGSLLLWRSQDGGQSWASVGNSIHVDQQIQTFTPDGGKLFVGNDGGIWSTTSPLAR